jgi:hypothetical protein
MGTSTHEEKPPEALHRLFVLPEQYRENCEAAADSGLARSAQEYWTACVVETYDDAPSGSRFLEILISSIILAYPPQKNDLRSNSARVREAMNAIFGRYKRDDKNDYDDSEYLRELVEHERGDGFEERNLRKITRKLISSQRQDADEESIVRRIVRKYRTEPDTVNRALRDDDRFRDGQLYRVFADVASLLASVGVRTAKAVALPSPVSVNVELPPSFSSDLDEYVP